MVDKAMTGDVVYPSDDVIARARVKRWEDLAEAAGRDLQGFWAAEARELHWFEPWTRVLDDDRKPFFKWVVGGKTNSAYNCLDRQAQTWRRNKLALMWEGEKGEFRAFSYFALRRETCKFANVLRSLGRPPKGQGAAMRVPSRRHRDAARRSPVLSPGALESTGPNGPTSGRVRWT